MNKQDSKPLERVADIVADEMFKALVTEFPGVAARHGYAPINATTANNDEDCTERVSPPAGELHHPASHFYIRQVDTYHPVGCVALRYTGLADHFKVCVSLCAAVDFNAGRWNRKKARDAAVGKLNSGRMGVIVYASDPHPFSRILMIISDRMYNAAHVVGLDFDDADKMLKKQLDFLYDRACEDEVQHARRARKSYL